MNDTVLWFFLIASAGATTCGDVKDVYTASSCCGSDASTPLAAGCAGTSLTALNEKIEWLEMYERFAEIHTVHHSAIDDMVSRVCRTLYGADSCDYWPTAGDYNGDVDPSQLNPAMPVELRVAAARWTSIFHNDADFYGYSAKGDQHAQFLPIGSCLRYAEGCTDFTTKPQLATHPHLQVQGTPNMTLGERLALENIAFPLNPLGGMGFIQTHHTWNNLRIMNCSKAVGATKWTSCRTEAKSINSHIHFVELANNASNVIFPGGEPFEGYPTDIPSYSDDTSNTVQYMTYRQLIERDYDSTTDTYGPWKIRVFRMDSQLMQDYKAGNYLRYWNGHNGDAYGKYAINPSP